MCILCVGKYDLLLFNDNDLRYSIYAFKLKTGNTHMTGLCIKLSEHYKLGQYKLPSRVCLRIGEDIIFNPSQNLFCI